MNFQQIRDHIQHTRTVPFLGNTSLYWLLFAPFDILNKRRIRFHLLFRDNGGKTVQRGVLLSTCDDTLSAWQDILSTESFLVQQENENKSRKEKEEDSPVFGLFALPLSLNTPDTLSYLPLRGFLCNLGKLLKQYAGSDFYLNVCGHLFSHILNKRYTLHYPAEVGFSCIEGKSLVRHNICKFFSLSTTYRGYTYEFNYI